MVQPSQLPGHGDHGQLGIEEGQLLGVPLEVAQVDHQVGLLLLDGLDHAAGVAVGVGKHKDLQICHLTYCAAYTEAETSLGVSKNAA